MATKSTNISIDEEVKAEATALFARIGLTLADGVNIFLHKVIAERGIPFPVESGNSLADSSTSVHPPLARTQKERIEAIEKLLELAKANPIISKDYKFVREECYDRAVFHR